MLPGTPKIEPARILGVSRPMTAKLTIMPKRSEAFQQGRWCKATRRLPPRQGVAEGDPIHIMWISTDKRWVPNHFVPLVPLHSMVTVEEVILADIQSLYTPVDLDSQTLDNIIESLSATLEGTSENKPDESRPENLSISNHSSPAGPEVPLSMGMTKSAMNYYLLVLRSHSPWG